VIDLNTKSIQSKVDLGAEGYTCKLSPDLKQLYISVWGAEKLLVWDVVSKKITKEIAVEITPTKLLSVKTENGCMLLMRMIILCQ
jgi:hypothetical protein